MDRQTAILKLREKIAEAEAIYVAHTEDLRRLQDRTVAGHHPHPPVTSQRVQMWLSKVRHLPNGRHRKVQQYAVAYYKHQKIRYNPLYLEQAEDNDLLDTVLHELGHLFTWYFCGSTGHGPLWRQIGLVVGYAPVGATSLEKRRRYSSFAAHAGAFAAETGTLGRVAKDNAIHHSVVTEPVKRVWAICDNNPGAPRNRILALCVAQGINLNTAKTQYYKWRKYNEF